MSVEALGGSFALLEAPPPIDPGAITFGGSFALLEEPPEGSFVRAFGGTFSLQAEVVMEPFTLGFGGRFALEADEGEPDPSGPSVVRWVDGEWLALRRRRWLDGTWHSSA